MFRQCRNTRVSAAGTASLTLLVTGLRENQQAAKIGNGVTVISVSLEKGLLAKADKVAKRQRISRAKLISHGLETVLAENSQ